MTISSTIYNPPPPQGLQTQVGSHGLAPNGFVHDVVAPSDSLVLSEEALSYTDPAQASKAGGEIGTALGTVVGGVSASAAAPEAAVIACPAGMIVGGAIGGFAGRVVGAAAAHASNTFEDAARWVFGTSR